MLPDDVHQAPRAQPAPGADEGPGEVLAALRTPSDAAALLRGFGPLAVGAVLFLLMVLLLPSVAPEKIVEVPVGTAASTTTTLAVAP